MRHGAVAGKAMEAMGEKTAFIYLNTKNTESAKKTSTWLGAKLSTTGFRDSLAANKA
jgi:hypothetical protein